MSEESIPRPAAHTDKPAVIALLHDADEISLLQLQLVLVLRHVTVQRLETGVGRRDKLVNAQLADGSRCEIETETQILLTFHS